MASLDETLDAIEARKVALENATQRLNDLLAEVRRRAADSTGLNQADEVATLLARAKAAYAIRKADIQAAANALPDLS
jgi:hypothetical protein